MTDHANELRRHARKIPHPQGETPGVMLRAADEIERLRAKIAEMERQEPSEQDASVRKAWARFSHELHRSPNAPYPGMSEAFEQHFSQSFIDREWRAEAATWAAAWKAAKRHCAQPAPSVPELIESLRCACNYIDKLGGVSQQYRAMLAAAPEAKP